MNSGNLVPSDHDRPEPAEAEIQFALVIARMIDTAKNSPDDLRQVIYDLARYKLQEQFTNADAKHVKRTQQALESAIRGVEAFSKQNVAIPSAVAPPPLVALGDPDVAPPAPRRLPPELIHEVPMRPRQWIDRGPRAGVSTPILPWPYAKRTLMMFSIVVGLLAAIQQRERLTFWIQNLPKLEKQIALQEQRPPTPAINDRPPEPPPKKPTPLRPTDYGVYALSNDSLIELQLLPGEPPDIRVAISADLKVPSRTILPNGHPKFIVFRKDIASSVSDHADVRVVAKIYREFAPGVAGKKPSGEDVWVMRNVAFPFRVSPVKDDPQMYELHSADPALELSPGRYALVLKNEAYDFSVEGQPVDPKQCMERIVGSNGTFYSDCKKL
jgi:hypothetical protein